MSVLDDFARMRLYRKRAAEYEQLSDSALAPDVQRRYRTIARHFRDLADREERSDQAQFEKRLELLRSAHRDTRQLAIRQSAARAGILTAVALAQSQIEAFLIICRSAAKRSQILTLAVARNDGERASEARLSANLVRADLKGVRTGSRPPI